MAVMERDDQGAPSEAAEEASRRQGKKGRQSIKCVVWDLDDTLWDGILLEDPEVRLKDGVVELLRTLDERGILHSIASRNDHDLAMAKLREFGIDEYFLYPQINWHPKSGSVQQIAKDINIGLDAIAFVDDQPFEREEVAFTCGEVRQLRQDRLGAHRARAGRLDGEASAHVVPRHVERCGDDPHQPPAAAGS